MGEEPDVDAVRKELGYYKGQLDRLAGERIRLDYLVAGLRHELKQKRQGFSLLAELQSSITPQHDTPAIFDATVRVVTATLGMNRTLILTPTGEPHRYRPAHWMGFRAEGASGLAGLTFAFPDDFASGGGRLLVSRATPPTPLIAQLRAALGLVTFLCLPVMGEGTALGIIVSGRVQENRPIYPALDESDLDTFQSLVNVIAGAVRNARLAQLERRLQEQDSTVRLASRIQLELLPSSPPAVSGYEIAGRTIPAQTVGGDYFDFIPIDDQRLAICLGDIAGKGLPASLLMANLQASIRGQALWNPSACDCLSRSNKLLFRSTDPGKYATMFYGVLNTQSHRLGYSNAGHNPPLLFAGARAPSQLAGGGTVLGLFEDSVFAEEVAPMRPGSLLVIYSDGITEAFDARGEEFGLERLETVVGEHPNASAGQLIDRILTAVNTHANDVPQADDMTLVVIRRDTDAP